MTALSTRPAATAADAPVRTRAERAAPVLVLTAGAVLAQLYVSIPLHAPIGHALGMSGVTEALSSGYAICYALGFLVYGPLSDHLGRRPVLLGGLAALVVTTAGVGMTNSIVLLAVLRAVQGGAAATFAPTAIAQAWGWRWVFFVSAIAMAALTGVLSRLVPRASRPAGGESLTTRYAQLARFTTRGPSLVLLLGHLMVLGGFVGFYTLVGPHLAHQGVSANHIMVIRAAALPAMFMSLAAGPLTRRFGAPTTTTGAYRLTAIGLVLARLGADDVALLTGASVVFVTGVALAAPCLITLWGDASAPQRGIGMAVNGFVLFLGASLGAYAPDLAPGFTGPLVLLAAGYAVAAALVLFAARALHAAR